MSNQKGNSTEKAYLRLYHTIREEIVSGIYPTGSRLPSKRVMAEESGVSVITVEHAYAILCEEGYAEARERSGYYVLYREEDFLSAVQERTTKVTENLHTDGGEFPFTVLAKTMRRVLSDYGERVLVKSPNYGCPELRRAISEYLARRGVTVRPEQIIIGAGAEYLYTLIAQLLGEYRFGVEQPCYDKIRRVYTACGVTYDKLKLGANGIKSEELAASRAAVLHVTPFHSFPSGVTADISKRREYVAWCRERDGYIIEDNYDSELTVSRKAEDPLYLLAGDRVIYLNTFSGTIAPSMRVGYMVLPEPLLKKFEKKLGFYSCTVATFEQYVLARLLDSGDFERHIHRVRRKRRKK